MNINEDLPSEDSSDEDYLPEAGDKGSDSEDEEIVKPAEDKENPSQPEETEETKKREDDLWADFLKDVDPPAKKAKEDSSSKVTVTKVFDFAGEEVRITKEVSKDSKEAKAVEKKPEEDKPVKPITPLVPLKRPGSSSGGGLSSLMNKISGKKPKMSTLEKSKLDWDSFKDKEGISEELSVHNRGKDGYLERQAFLERTDVRQFEIERDLRTTKRPTKR